MTPSQLEQRVAALEKRAVESQASLIRSAAKVHALERLLAELAQKTGHTEYWHRQLPAALLALQHESEAKQLKQIEEIDGQLAGSLRHLLKQSQH